jgi:hypothetical protein
LFNTESLQVLNRLAAELSRQGKPIHEALSLFTDQRRNAEAQSILDDPFYDYDCFADAEVDAEVDDNFDWYESEYNGFSDDFYPFNDEDWIG